MTEEELREKGRELLLNNIAVFKCSNTAYANAYLYEQLADDLFYKILTLIRESGLFLDMEMVKGLMFEAQAKKCSQCLKNREEKDYEWECEMQHRKEQSETP